jgi:diguanylate cyclase (GGDEF)-like protein/PAS domain S-box-containing protein
MSDGGFQKRVRKSPVLVVDDEPQVLTALEDVLGDDYEVLKATSPEQALKLAQAEPNLAVVLSDHRMPGMTGAELLTRLSQKSDATRVMVTGFAELGGVIHAINSGRIFAYVTKPWNPSDLRMTVQKGVEHFDLVRKLSHERQLLDDLINTIPDAIYFKDCALRFQRMNPAYAERLALKDGASAIGKRLVELGVAGHVAAAIESEESAILLGGQPFTDLVREHAGPDGRRVYSATLTPVRSAAGEVVGLVGISRDITARYETERALRRLTRVRSMLGAVNGAIHRIKERDAFLSEACRIAVDDGALSGAAFAILDHDANRAHIVAASGVSAEPVEEFIASELAGLCLSSTDGCEDRGPWLFRGGAGAPSFLGEAHSMGVFPLIRDDRIIALFVLVAGQSDFFDTEEVRLLSELSTNVAAALELIQKTRRLSFLSYYDDVTGLAKRELFLDRLQQLLPGRLLLGGGLAVVLVDINRFRHINDTFGRAIGNALLIQVAARLNELVGERDTLGRFDSNAFAFVLNAPGTEKELSSWIDGQVAARLRTPFKIGEVELRIAHRVGVALFPDDATNAEELVRNAEAALADARATGQRALFYAPSMNARVAEKLSLENRLRRALEEDQFCLHYQPKFNLVSGALVGLEALIRWNDPERGMVSPASFIPVLEETGLILEVGRWVITRAVAQYQTWLEQRVHPPPIAVNVSPLQLMQPTFVESVQEALTKYPAARGFLDLEITESVLMHDLVGNITKLQAVRDEGCKIAIDDFGTGYSSLGYLSRLPIDALKIDRSFVIRMAEDAQDLAIVRTIISLAHSLNKHVIAEGVETPEQAQLLTSVGCDQVQGYLFGRPEAPERVEARFIRRLA